MASAGIRPSTMRAVQYSGYGGGSVALKKDEVLIKVEAASMNPADCKIQKGLLRPFVPKFPFIPVSDVAGEIVEVGSAVREFKAGDKVVSKLNFLKAGGLAEYVAAPASLTVARPAGVSAADAAGLPIAGLTALQALKAVGTKFDGTGGARNLELVASIGADEVLDYKTPKGAVLKSSSGKEYDYIVNTTNGGKWSPFKATLSSHGRVVDIAPNLGNFVASILTLFSKKKLSMVLLSLGKEDLKFLLQLVKEGKLKTVIDSRHPFEKAADAWEKSMGGHATGKVIIEM